MFSYMPIVTSQTKELFFDYIKNMQLKEINYVSIGVQDTVNKKTTSLMSSEEWQEMFTNNNYAQHDPLRKLILNTNRSFIMLDEIGHIDTIGAEIMNQRKKIGIEKGIVMVERYKGCNYVLTLASDNKNFDSYDYLRENYVAIKSTIRNLKEIIYNDSIPYIKDSIF